VRIIRGAARWICRGAVDHAVAIVVETVAALRLRRERRAGRTRWRHHPAGAHTAAPRERVVDTAVAVVVDFVADLVARRVLEEADAAPVVVEAEFLTHMAGADAELLGAPAEARAHGVVDAAGVESVRRPDRYVGTRVSHHILPCSRVIAHIRAN